MSSHDEKVFLLANDENVELKAGHFHWKIKGQV